MGERGKAECWSTLLLPLLLISVALAPQRVDATRMSLSRNKEGPAALREMARNKGWASNGS